MNVHLADPQTISKKFPNRGGGGGGGVGVGGVGATSLGQTSAAGDTTLASPSLSLPSLLTFLVPPLFKRPLSARRYTT